MDNVNIIYSVVGFLVLANGATIITVFTSAIKISSQFGSLQSRVEANTKGIEKNEKRIYNLEMEC